MPMLTPQQLAALRINTQQLAQNPGGWAQVEADRQAVVDKMPSTAPAAANYESPLALGEAKRLGLTPQQFAMDMQLRTAGPGVRSAMGGGIQFHNATATDLERDPRFLKAMQTRPAEALKLFKTVTGTDYNTHAKAQLAIDTDRTKFQTETVQKKLASGDWTMRDGKIMSRKLVPNPSGTGEMILGNDYSELDEFERTLVNPTTQANVIDPDIDRYRALDAKRAVDAAAAAGGAPKVATLQKTGNSPIDGGMRVGMGINNAIGAVGNFVKGLPEMSQRVDDYFGIPGMNNTFRNWVGGTTNMLLPALEMATGNQYQRYGVVEDNFQRPGQDPRRMRATLQNSQHFQQLLKDDPQRAMALVAAMQNP